MDDWMDEALLMMGSEELKSLGQGLSLKNSFLQCCYCVNAELIS